jgi:hypothetical protein
VTSVPGLSLDDGMSESGLTFDELWMRQLGIGGDVGRLEVEAYVLGLLIADPFQYDMLAHTLNECFMERGLTQRVGYWPTLDDASAD